MRLSLLPLLALSSSVLVAATPELAAPHLAAGQAALASGQYLDASRAFSEALGQSPLLPCLPVALGAGR